MTEDSLTIHTILFAEKLAAAALSKGYENVKKQALALNKPLFSVKQLRGCIDDISYRKINDWDTKNLISGSRDKSNVGWRRFSICDVIKLNVISDLRKFGFNTEHIKTVIKRLPHPYIPSYGEKHAKQYSNFLQLEYFFFLCLAGQKIVLLLDGKEGVLFLEENESLWAHTQLGNFSCPLLILPFFSYVKNTKAILKKDIRIKDTAISAIKEHDDKIVRFTK